MAARSSWSGAITFAGFPLPVKAYNLLSSPSKSSFKTLCDCHEQPIRAPRVCATTSAELADHQQLKGVEVAKGSYVALDATAVQAIDAVGKTVAIQPEAICPVDSIDFAYATAVYRLIGDAKLGAAKPVAILWTALGKTNSAIVSRWVMRAGSADGIVAIHADAHGLLASTLAFAHLRNDVPASDAPLIAVEPAELAMFEQAMGALYPNRPFDVADYVSDHNARREQAIQAAVAGQPIAAPAAAATPAVPDLMAALQASLAAVQTTTNGKEAVPA